MDSIFVVYHDCLPDEIIQEFQSACKNEYNINIDTHKEAHHYLNFDGEEYNLIVYIRDNSAELVAGTFVAMVYNIFKLSVCTLWKSIWQMPLENFTVNQDYQDNHKKMSLRIGNGNQFMEIVIDHCFDSSNMYEKFRSLKQLLSSRLLTEYLSNADYFSDPQKKPRIKIKYNQGSKSWEAVNYRMLRENFKQLFDEANRI